MYETNDIVVIVQYTQGRRQGVKRGTSPPKPGKFAMTGKQPTPQPAVSKRKFKFFVNFLKILLKFSKSCLNF